MREFPVDTGRIDVEPNSVLTHALVSYYEEAGPAGSGTDVPGRGLCLVVIGRPTNGAPQ